MTLAAQSHSGLVALLAAGSAHRSRVFRACLEMFEAPAPGFCRISEES